MACCLTASNYYLDQWTQLTDMRLNTLQWSAGYFNPKYWIAIVTSDIACNTLTVRTSATDGKCKHRCFIGISISVIKKWISPLSHIIIWTFSIWQAISWVNSFVITVLPCQLFFSEINIGSGNYWRLCLATTTHWSWKVGDFNFIVGDKSNSIHLWTKERHHNNHRV